ncbi:MAG: hypothetical protein AW10_00580 [Candidatus Accumulibacter appositus]|uniref:Uncharacterized protein n=1 Tax=Candidatus Accumulibacter appositus TaxID=1454003 RepID=A0A011PZW4_9PROT|nr:MAG: hypothetical protein AW10_00580 [Candidatus Accumulibacter appositus]
MAWVLDRRYRSVAERPLLLVWLPLASAGQAACAR